MNSSGNNLNEDIKNLCSILTLFSPEELIILSTIISLFLAKILTSSEQNVVGTLLTVTGGNLQLSAAQEQFINTVEEVRKQKNSK